MRLRDEALAIEKIKGGIMKAVAIRLLVGAALLLQLAPACADDSVKLAYIS